MATLKQFQDRFLAALGRPLILRDGELKADAREEPLVGELRDGPFLDGAARLGLHRRLYWSRLLDALHTDYPLVTALVGPHEVNLAGLEFFALHPPRGYDVQLVSAGFGEWCTRRWSTIPPLAEARAIDEAVRDTLRGAHRAGAVSWRLIEEHWPLLELRSSVDPLVPRRLPLGEPLAGARHHAVGLGSGRVVTLALEPAEHALLGGLEHATLEDTLAELEEAYPLSLLEAKVPGWLARATAMGILRAELIARAP